MVTERRRALEGAAVIAPALTRRPESARRAEREDGEGRTWGERNRAQSYRVREEDAGRLASAARRLGMSKDQVARALVWAALDALEDGRLELETRDVRTEVEDSMQRVRIYVRREGRPRWRVGMLPQENDPGAV
jgi:hypothetical protein